MCGIRNAPTGSCESVYPSGFWVFAITPGPSMPPPPGLFSTTMFCPTYFEATSANLRRCVSVEPPGGQGQTSVIVREGKACPRALPAAMSRAAASQVEAVRTFREAGIACLLLYDFMVRADYTQGHGKPSCFCFAMRLGPLSGGR